MKKLLQNVEIWSRWRDVLPCPHYTLLFFIVFSGDIVTLFDTGKGKTEPLVVPMATGELAVCRDEVTIFLTVDEKGEHQQKHAITWSDGPLGLEFVDPYIIAILPKHIEICSRQPQSVVQRIDTTGARKIIRGPDCYASSISYVWRSVMLLLFVLLS